MEELPIGRHRLGWTGNNLDAGIYFIRMEVIDKLTKKMKTGIISSLYCAKPSGLTHLCVHQYASPHESFTFRVGFQLYLDTFAPK